MRVNGTKIQVKRLKIDKKTSELAVAADLSERRIQQIEKGKIVNINRNVAKAIAEFLGVKLEVITGGAP